MRYKPKYLDLTYTAALRTPLFALGSNSIGVLHALYGELSKKYAISAADMSVDAGRSLGDVRVTVSLFSGNGSIEIAAESVTAKFINPTDPKDGEIIQDCLQMTHDALASLAGARPILFKQEGVVLRMFVELIDPPNDGPTFLRSLVANQSLFGSFEGTTSVEAVPGFHLEMVAEDEKWFFIFDAARAQRDRKELYVSITGNYGEGNSFPTLKQKGDHFNELLKAGLRRAQLEPAS